MVGLEIEQLKSGGVVDLGDIRVKPQH
jgi:hypothetical protein